MTREELQQALAQANASIASLNAQLHPPPEDPGERNRLEASLNRAMQSKAALEQALANLPSVAAVSFDIPDAKSAAPAVKKAAVKKAKRKSAGR